MAAKGLRMKLVVSKWGNSLAVRLPAESLKRIGAGEGDTLIAEVSADGRLVLSPEGPIGKAPSARPSRAVCVNFLATRRKQRRRSGTCAAARATDDLRRCLGARGILCLDEAMIESAKSLGMSVVTV